MISLKQALLASPTKACAMSHPEQVLSNTFSLQIRRFFHRSSPFPPSLPALKISILDYWQPWKTRGFKRKQRRRRSKKRSSKSKRTVIAWPYSFMAWLAGQKQGTCGQPAQGMSHRILGPSWMQAPERMPRQLRCCRGSGTPQSVQIQSGQCQKTLQGDEFQQGSRQEEDTREPEGQRSQLQGLRPEGEAPEESLDPITWAGVQGELQEQGAGKGRPGCKTKGSLVPQGEEPAPSQGGAEKAAPWRLTFPFPLRASVLWAPSHNRKHGLSGDR